MSDIRPLRGEWPVWNSAILAVFNDRFGEELLKRHGLCRTTVELWRPVSLHRHQASLSAEQTPGKNPSRDGYTAHSNHRKP